MSVIYLNLVKVLSFKGLQFVLVEVVQLNTCVTLVPCKEKGVSFHPVVHRQLSEILNAS